VLLLEALVVGVPVLALAGLAGYDLLNYRSWEAHYRGRPTSWWAARLRVLPPQARARPDGWYEPPAAPPGADPAPYHLILGGDPAAVPVLVELLGQPDAPTARLAAWGLHNTEQGAVFRGLRDLIEGGPEPARLRAAAVWWRMSTKRLGTPPPSDV
jgi:hypothetical protein